MRAQVPSIQVACGVVFDPAGRILLAQRPEGKIAAGLWEFPGGKIEAGESPEAALRRELLEELGIVAGNCERLLRFRHRYSDREVWLDTWCVRDFSGVPISRENQAFAWLSSAEIAGYSILPTVRPILRALRLPGFYVFTPPQISEYELERGIGNLPPGAWLRLRLPGHSSARYAAIARRAVDLCRARGLALMLDRDPELVLRLEAQGWHAPESVWRSLSAPPQLQGRCFWGSVHDVAGAAALRALGAEAAVIGNVGATASHPGRRALDWSEVGAAADVLPVYAIGGLGVRDLSLARYHGAQGVAGISAFWAP
jgi:8-oxo-dGTP diphosphatase